MKNTFSDFVKSVGDAVASAADAASTAVDTSLTAAKNSAEKAGHSALEFGKSAGEAVGGVADAASNFASRAGESISDSASKSLAVVKSGAVAAGESAAAGAKSAGTALGVAADSAGNALGALGVLVGDLNGDGKVDFEDAKIAAARARDVAGVAAAELGQLAKTTLKSELVKDVAAGAVVGGAMASVIPLMGTATGSQSAQHSVYTRASRGSNFIQHGGPVTRSPAYACGVCSICSSINLCLKSTRYRHGKARMLVCAAIRSKRGLEVFKKYGCDIRR